MLEIQDHVADCTGVASPTLLGFYWNGYTIVDFVYTYWSISFAMSQPVRDSNQQNSSVSSFDKLHELCAEIRDEVRDVVQYTAPDGQTNIEELLNEKFEQLFSESNNQVTPEVDHAVELFRMYVDEVHYMRELDNNKDKKSDEVVK